MPDLTKKQSDIRFNNRRKMAWLSFWLICAVGIGLIVIGLLSDSVVDRIDKLAFIIGSLFGVWGGIVLAYFGASAYSDKNDLKYSSGSPVPDEDYDPRSR